MFNLEKALATWRHQYKYSRAFKGRDLDELEQHLRDQVAFLTETGTTEEDAFREAVAELGTYHETESEFQSVAWMKTRDRREVVPEIRHQLTMLANYLKVASRNLRKAKVASLINIGGLSVAIAVSVVSYLYVLPTFTKDHFHDRAEDIFLVHQVTQEEYGEQWWGYSPLAMGPALAAESASLESVVRVENTAADVRKMDRQYQKWLVITDATFFAMFDFEIESGDVSRFGSEPGVVLSSPEARFLFGDADPIGQMVDITLNDGRNLLLPVLAVAGEPRMDTSLNLDVMLPFSLVEETDDAAWDRRVDATFVMRHKDVTEEALRTELNRYLDRANAVRDEASGDVLLTRFDVDNLKHLSWNRSRVKESVANWMPWMGIIILSSLSALLLLLACFNYLNISMAMVTRRIREIGVRKAVGGQRRQLVLQFMTENVLVTVLSLVIGLGLAATVLIPIFSQIAGGSLSLGLTDNLRVWVFMIVIVATVGVLSGAYPALYISSFRPIAIFQKRTQTTRRRPVAHGFLAFQFILAFLTVSAAITLVQNNRFLSEMDWGFEADQRLLVRTQDAAEFDMVMATLESHSGVSEHVSSKHAVGFSTDVVFAESVDSLQQRVVTRRFSAEAGYPSFLGIDLVAGRSLDEPDGTFGPEAIVVNEAFVDAFHLTDPVGTVVVVDSTARSIVGVTENFHYDNFYSPVYPAFFEASDEEGHVYANAAVATGQMDAVIEAIEQAYAERFPDRTAQVTYQDRVLQRFQEENASATAIFTFVSLLALAISCLSIYALSTQNILNRMKEIGVRKVLGGEPFRIAHLVNRRYFTILTIGSVLAAPVAWFVLDALLSELYAYRMTMSPLPLVLAYAVIGGVALLTISTQARRIRKNSPAHILRVD